MSMAMLKFIAALFIVISTNAHAQTFMGYACIENCSGHEAGYNWAERKGVTDPSDCTGNSNSFIEGCQAYTEEQQEEQ